RRTLSRGAQGDTGAGTAIPRCSGDLANSDASRASNSTLAAQAPPRCAGGRPEPGAAPQKGCHGNASVPLVVKVNAGDDLDGDYRRDYEVDHEAERRPPLRIGHEVSAVLPEILQAMTGEADDKQPRCAGDRCGGDEDESAGHAGFDSDDLPAPIAADCETDVD